MADQLNDMVRVRADAMETFVAATFQAAGCPRDEAGRIGLHLVRANLTGHDSHGVIRVPRYLQWMRDDRVHPGRHIEILRENPAMAVVDGCHGFGQTIGPEAVQFGIDKAAKLGVAIVALRRSGHLGRIGDWAEMAAGQGLVAIHFINVSGSVLVAPHGAVERRISTAPFAIGVPMGDGDPVILDFATSAVAEGKALVAFRGGAALPDNALIGPDGAMTGDPAVLYGAATQNSYPDPRNGPGALRTMGEHKGSGLAIMMELLGGAFTGSGTAGPGERPLHNGMLSIYMDPEFFHEGDWFGEEVANYVAFVRGARPARADQPMMLPGDKERRTTAERRADGIPLSRTSWDDIRAAARAQGVDDALADAAFLAAP